MATTTLGAESAFNNLTMDALAGIPTPAIADTIERLLTELDTRDGDLDIEPNGDELDGNSSEEDFMLHAHNGAGCPVADPGEYAYSEWISRGATKSGRKWFTKTTKTTIQTRALTTAPRRATAHQATPTTPRTTATRKEFGMGKPAPLPQRSPSPPPAPEIAPEDCPDVYASVCVGTCLEPEFHDGACIVFSKTELPGAGDFVGVWFMPGVAPPGQRQRWVKRLAMGLMPGLTFPYVPPPHSEMEPVVVLEMLNPPRRFHFAASQILAMHKVVGEAVSMGNGTAQMRRPA